MTPTLKLTPEVARRIYERRFKCDLGVSLTQVQLKKYQRLPAYINELPFVSRDWAGIWHFNPPAIIPKQIALTNDEK